MSLYSASMTPIKRQENSNSLVSVNEVMMTILPPVILFITYHITFELFGIGISEQFCILCHKCVPASSLNVSCCFNLI